MRQVEPETTTWLTARNVWQLLVQAGYTSGDFALVPTSPYAEVDEGTYGFPITEEMENRLIAAHREADSDMAADDQIGILLQVNILEAHRRALAGQRQGRREMLAHLNHQLSNVATYNDLMLQVITGTAKKTQYTADE